ncbi:hypothetical protein Ahy_B05g076722 [Arachis hypogaea]|uniref:Putative plant transposon protein domain-containing protein n=2 Tax=Arachis hypogaea TaxID=3818 RepID=A0A444Z3U3_ARAHY|nr:hypothetical protein Ahy_B05g076722 [Arachis hypogaea]
MASSSRTKRRRGKEPIVEKNTSEFDQWKFRSWYHQLQLEWMSQKKIYPEVPLLLPDDECQEMKAKIRKRRWEELISPITKINANIIWEFYANTPRTEMNQAPTYKSYVRGTEVDFSPNTIMKVLKLRATHFDKPGYHQRLNEEQDYDEIASEISVVNTEWVGTTKNKYKYLRRGDLTPEAKCWYELMKRSILGTVNNSEVNKKRAIMLYCIITGGEVKIHEIIANDIQRLAEKNSAEG